MKIRFLPKKSHHDKQLEIWNGIVQKTLMDGDESLSTINVRNNFRQILVKRLATVAAVISLIIGISILFYRNINSNYTLNHEEIALIFADTTSSSRLVLSNGDTILLDDINEAISFIESKNNNVVLEFDKDEVNSWDYGPNIVESGRGKQINIVLPDGSKVWLNASSKIEFPSRFVGDSRVVKVHGEAYFEVVSDPVKPFIVNFGDDEIKVLGTHFNVKDYDNDPKKLVTLLEGSVLVTNKKISSRSNLLKPSEQVVIFDNGYGTQVQTLKNPYGSIAWKSGDFYFENADIDLIVKELERWYPVKIIVANKNISKKISGKIKRSDSLGKVAEMLRFFEIDLLIEKQI